MSTVLLNGFDKKELVLFCPNQFMAMDMTSFKNRYQYEVAEIMMQFAQVTLKFNPEIIKKDVDGKNVYSLDLCDVNDYISEVPIRKSEKERMDDILNLQKVSIRTYGDYSLKQLSVFPWVEIDKKIGECTKINFTMAGDLEYSFKNKNSIISHPEIKKVSFTGYDIVELNELCLSEYARNFLKSIIRHFNFIHTKSKVGYGVIEFKYEEFKYIIGVGERYKRYNDLKSKVIDNIINEINSIGFNLEVSESRTGRSVNKLLIKIEINDTFVEWSEKITARANKKEKEDEKESKPKKPKLEKVKDVVIDDVKHKSNTFEQDTTNLKFYTEEENKDLSNKLDLNDESDYEQELTEQERENNTFKTILRSLGKHDVIIDKFMELDDYVRYCDFMNKVNLKPVTAIDFNLGFKYKSK